MYKFEVGDIIKSIFPTRLYREKVTHYYLITKVYHGLFFNKKRMMYDYICLNDGISEHDTVEYVDEMFEKIA
jgi:hypothetical protein